MPYRKAPDNPTGGTDAPRYADFKEAGLVSFEIDIGQFTGSRNMDAALANKLFKMAMQNDPLLAQQIDGLDLENYVLHHSMENGTLQVIPVDYHRGFPHTGGFSYSFS